MRPALVAAGLLLAGGIAAAHGASMEEQAQFGPFKVTYFGYTYTTVAEQIRPAWKVQDGAGRGVSMNGTVLNVTVVDVKDRAIATYDRALTETTPGFVYLDLLTGPRGALRFRLPLPGAHVATFEQPTCDVDAQGQLACGPEAARTPGPETLLVLGILAGAALAGRAPRAGRC